MDRYTAPDRENCVLLTIDVQNDFTLPESPTTIDGTQDIIPKIQQLLDVFRKENLPVVHIVRLYKQDGSNVDLCRKKSIENGKVVVQPGTMGAELVDELKPSSDVYLDSESLLNNEFQRIGDREWILYKPRWSGFYKTDLQEFLEGNSISTVVVCGCNFPNCPRTTIYDASQRDYKIVLIPDATSKTYKRGIEELKNIGVAIKNTKQAIEWIK